jgi:hypothetical protein
MVPLHPFRAAVFPDSAIPSAANLEFPGNPRKIPLQNQNFVLLGFPAHKARGLSRFSQLIENQSLIQDT